VKTLILVFGPKQFFPSFRSDIKKNFFEAIKEIDPTFHKTLSDHGKRVEVFRATVDQEAFIRQRPPFPFALIGDAASFKDQTTANGITSALRDALILSDELHQALTGQKSSDLALIDYHSRHYLDLFHFYEFTATQAEANPLRPEEERLYRAISKNQSERDRFISLYFDSEEVKPFFNSRRIETLTAGEMAAPPREEDLLSRYKDPFSAKTPELHLEPYLEFYRRREAAGTFQYSRTLHSFPGNTTRLSDDVGRMIDGINFASQDYLGLGQDPEIREATIEALNQFGPHSAGSPMIIGNTLISKQLEEELKILTGKKHVLLFPTGYAAGIGSILGIVKPEDHIVMDRLSHACLQQGARAATRKIHKFAHLDANAARANLEAIRRKDTNNAILLITEGLFSMDADSPDLRKFQDLAHEFNATLFVDVAHDLGATGPGGRGQIGAQGMYGKIDLVMGSFSKTFASNGGFLATDSESLLHYLKMYSTPHLFSNALSPVQAGVALKATQIIQNSKGEMLRQKLMASVIELRKSLSNEGLHCYGNPSPIVPVFIGTERDARTCHKKIVENNLAAMIIEYPVVPLGASRFRLQVMASHSIAEVQHAARVIGNVMRQVKGEQITTRPHFSSTPSESALCFQLHSRVVPLT
jgi:glycine C-acetyltransferase